MPLDPPVEEYPNSDDLEVKSRIASPTESILSDNQLSVSELPTRRRIQSICEKMLLADSFRKTDQQPWTRYQRTVNRPSHLDDIVSD